MNYLKVLLNKVWKDNAVTAKERGAIVLAATTPYDRQRVKIVLSRGTIKQQKQQFKEQFETVLKPQPDYLPVADVTGDGHISFTDGDTQGALGTCAIVAASWGNINYQINTDNTWTFKFFDNDGKPVFTTVSAQRSLIGSTGEIGVYERAYAAMLAQTDSLAPSVNAWQKIGNGNDLGDVLRHVRGYSAREYAGAPSILDIEASLSMGKTILVATTGDAPRQYLLQSHAYRVLGSTDGVITLRNPWGTDGALVQGLDDGIISIPYSTFKSEITSGNGGIYAIG